MIQLSWTADAGQIAEALAHEYYHGKLNNLLDVQVLVEDEGTIAHYSPWRDDPRPIAGLVHAVYSFYIVSVFWQAAYTEPLPGIDRAWLAREIVRRTKQTESGLAALHTHASLSPAGAAFVDEIERRLRALPLPDLPSAVLASIDRDLTEHRLNWTLRQAVPKDEAVGRLTAHWDTTVGQTGALRQLPSVERFVPTDEAISAICVRLGMPEGIPINQLADRTTRRDLTLDILGRLSVTEPDAFAQLAAAINALDIGEVPLKTLFAGHLAYVQGDFLRAVDLYGRVVAAAPANLDSWRDFAFALRHAGFWEEANTFFFQPQVVVGFAAARGVERAAIDRALPVGPTRLPAASNDAAAGLYLRLLLWLRQASER